MLSKINIWCGENVRQSPFLFLLFAPTVWESEPGPLSETEALFPLTFSRCKLLYCYMIKRRLWRKQNTTKWNHSNLQICWIHSQTLSNPFCQTLPNPFLPSSLFLVRDSDYSWAQASWFLRLLKLSKSPTHFLTSQQGSVGKLCLRVRVRHSWHEKRLLHLSIKPGLSVLIKPYISLSWRRQTQQWVPNPLFTCHAANNHASHVSLGN